MSKEALSKAMEGIYKILIIGLVSIVAYFLKLNIETLNDLRVEMNEVRQWEAVDRLQHQDFIESGKNLNQIVTEHEKIIQKNINKGRLEKL